MIKCLFSILFQLILVVIAVLITLIYTAKFEYENVNSSLDFKPKLLRDGQYLTFKHFPLETEYSIDNIELSLVIPAYNEEKRLPPVIDLIVEYFKNNTNYEIIIANDGSKDKTWEVVRNIIKKYPNVSISAVTFNKNGGKGYAVASGMKFTRGKYILMLDADGATNIQDYEKLFNKMESLIDTNENGVVVIGSRNTETDEHLAQRSFIRNLLSYVNNFVVRTLIGIKDIKDTQCGFKLFSRIAAKKIFYNLHLTRWAFDVEMIYIAQHSNIIVSEIPVSFEDVPGSKLNIVTATISFFRDYFAILTYYTTGVWKII